LRPKPKSKCDKPVQLVVDSTGLKIFGEGDWLEEKHKTRRKRRVSDLLCNCDLVHAS